MVTMEIFVAAFSSLAVIVAGAFFWIMSEIRALRRETREDNRAMREEFREDNRAMREEFRAQSQRILEALYFHRHDSDGTAAFYPPTPARPAPPAD